MKCWKGNQKKDVEETKMKRNKKRKTRVELIPHTAENDPWSDHPETQFGPTYPFFRNPEPKPTLCAIKVYFD